MLKHLTEAAVEKIKPDPAQRFELNDLAVPGLRLRVTPNGKKTWSVMFKVAGAAIDGGRGPNRRLTIGAYPLIGLKAARLQAQEVKDKADRGIDPVDAQKADVARRFERRFDRLVDQFITLYAKPSTKRWQNTEQILKTHAVAEWEMRDVTTIDRVAIHHLLDTLARKKGVALAREVRKHLSTFFNWLVDRGICAFNPMAGMKRRDLQYVARDRVLSIEELRAIWRAAETLGYPFGPIVRLLILTAQRRSEIANLKRDWIRGGHIEIPAENYKTGIAQVVPLTQCSVAILAGQPVWNHGDHVFSTSNGRTPSSGFSKAKARLDKQCGISDWTLHDIRRSVATHMASAGVLQEHIERVLGHAIAGVAGTYNRYSYVDEKRSALQNWEAILQRESMRGRP